MDKKTVKCEKCSALNEADARFCENCGNPLTGIVQTAPPQMDADEDAAPAQPPDISPDRAGSPPRSKTWIYLLSGCAGLLLLCLVAGGILYLLRSKIELPEFLNVDALLKEETEEGLPFPETEDEPAQFGEYSPPSDDQSEQSSRDVEEEIESAPIEVEINTNRDTFYCVPSEGETTLKISVAAGEDAGAMVVRWRMVDKVNDNTTEWKEVSMQYNGSGKFEYTFDANVWDGTNNFYYPPLMHESWFEFEIIAADGSYRSEVFKKEVTFFPCAQ